MRILNAELQELQPFLFSNDFKNDPIEALDKAGLTYLAKTHDGLITLIVVNTTLENKGRVSFTLPRLASSPITVKFEDGRTLAHGRTLTDTFAPYDVHIYEFTP